MTMVCFVKVLSGTELPRFRRALPYPLTVGGNDQSNSGQSLLGIGLPPHSQYPSAEPSPQ